MCFVAWIFDFHKVSCLTQIWRSVLSWANIWVTAYQGELLLSDLSSWPSLQSELREFLDEMTDYQREQYDGWCRENLQEIDGGKLSLKTSSQVVYFEAGKDMKVR